MGAKIPGGLVEFTTKFEATDRPIEREEILENGWLTADELEYIKGCTEKINEIISRRLLDAGIILADFKIEFGRDSGGAIILADEVGTPDGCRFWDLSSYEQGRIESLDKDVYRYDTGDLSDAYLRIQRRICG